MLGRAIALGALLAAGASRASAQSTPPAWRNVVGVLAAATIVEGDLGATFGLSYEHRLGRWYGIGAFADYLTASNRNVATGVAFYLHPTNAIKATIAPGVDFRRTGPDLVLLRMGVSYGFATGSRWMLSPGINIDFEGGYRVFVVGVELGWRF
jgi:hypothetical protein